MRKMIAARSTADMVPLSLVILELWQVELEVKLSSDHKCKAYRQGLACTVKGPLIKPPKYKPSTTILKLGVDRSSGVQL